MKMLKLMAVATIVTAIASAALSNPSPSWQKSSIAIHRVYFTADNIYANRMVIEGIGFTKLSVLYIDGEKTDFTFYNSQQIAVDIEPTGDPQPHKLQITDMYGLEKSNIYRVRF